MEGDPTPSASPGDGPAGLLEAALASPFEAERDALWAEALATTRDALLESAVDRLLADPPADPWLTARVEEELGPEAPRLLDRALAPAGRRGPRVRGRARAGADPVVWLTSLPRAELLGEPRASCGSR